jgi:hypothetical protein
MFTPNRLISATGILAITLGLALTAMGQQSSGVNTSRSNIKNNLNIKVVEGPPGKVRCIVTGEKIAKDCTKDQVDLLNKALTTSVQKGTAADDARVSVELENAQGGTTPSEAQRTSKSKAKPPQLSLAPNGSLLCDKKPCTAANLADVNNAAAAMKADLTRGDKPKL